MPADCASSIAERVAPWAASRPSRVRVLANTRHDLDAKWLCIAPRGPHDAWARPPRPLQRPARLLSLFTRRIRGGPR
jgi:hypothetical protein